MEETVVATGSHDQPNLYGHLSAQTQLVSALKADKLHHAWLFSGIPGIGKATLAYFFVRYLLSIQETEENGLFGDSLPPPPLPDRLTDLPTDSDLFQLIANKSHPDFRLVQRSADEKTGRMRADIAIAQIRDLSQFLHMTPSLSKWRVVMIDGAEEMNRAAANALLKILEEPPKNAIVILVSHAPGRLLPTLRSRCRHLRLAPLDETSLQAVWQDIARGRGLSESDFQLGQQVFPGSIGHILSFCELDGAKLLGYFDQYFGQGAKTSRADLIKLTDEIASCDEEQFQLFLSLFSFWLASQIKFRACQPDYNAFSLQNWTDLWDQARHKLKRLQQAHLDKKMVLLEIFCAIDELVRR